MLHQGAALCFIRRIEDDRRRKLRPLPDTSRWQPKRDNQVALRRVFLQTCRSVEARIKAESDIEKSFNINNFDSGPGLEDIVREQFRALLPDRYAVTAGVVIDANGYNCGDCDMIVANRFWQSLLKYGATEQSRRIHVPVEAVYSVIEIKQTLTEASLDSAMEKLVMYKHLERDRSEYGRLVENHTIRELDKPGASLNPRFDAVLAIGCEPGTDARLVKRFFRINRTLSSAHRINALAILGAGFACYVDEFEDGGSAEHLYPEIDVHPIYTGSPRSVTPMYVETERDALYWLYTNLLQHLTLTVLNFRGQKFRYGRHDADGVARPINLDEEAT